LTQQESTRNGAWLHGFGYDLAGNPTTFKGVSQTFNSNNQNTAVVHDGEGNPATHGGNGLGWDPENRLTAYGATLTAGYTPGGLRAWKQTAAGRTYFLYDGAVPVVEMDATGAVTATNTFGAGGLLSRRSGGSSAFYTFDPQGSTAQRLNGAGWTPQARDGTNTSGLPGSGKHAEPRSRIEPDRQGDWAVDVQGAAGLPGLVGARLEAPQAL
jgi:hypothetical protein